MDYERILANAVVVGLLTLVAVATADGISAYSIAKATILSFLFAAGTSAYLELKRKGWWDGTEPPKNSGAAKLSTAVFLL